MRNGLPGILCSTCGASYPDTRTEEEQRQDGPKEACPLCSNGWDIWELRFAPIPLEKNRAQIASWLGHLPFPSAIDITCTANGIRMRMFAPRDSAAGAVRSWAAMTHQQTRWTKVSTGCIPSPPARYVLRNTTHVPTVSLADRGGDPVLAISGYLMNHRGQCDNGIRMWFTGKDPDLQARLQALASYSYGTESGVGNASPNPWGMRLAALRALAVLGTLTAGVFAGAAAAGWIHFFVGMIGALAGTILVLGGAFGLQDWMHWRSIPKAILEARTEDVLLKTTIVYYGEHAPQELSLLTGRNAWVPVDRHVEEWPYIRSCPITLSAADMATMIAPPEMGEPSGVMARDVIQEIPAPPPSEPLLSAPFKIGTSVADERPVGIDPDAHGIAAGGSRSGKTSIAYATLVQLILRGDDAPGIFLVDPHLSLADGLLEVIHNLPPEQRAKAIRRLRIISPDQPEVVPLNLLTIKDFSWAGNAIVQIGRRIWDDYWGPRMQAALLSLFRLAHAWNQAQAEEAAVRSAEAPAGDLVIPPVKPAAQAEPPAPSQDTGMPGAAEGGTGTNTADPGAIPAAKMEEKAMPGTLGLLHVVFSAYNIRWRHLAMNYIQGADRLAVLALDALLGQFGGDDNNKNQRWVTEVVSPILSKVMALELSPWLFSALHQDSFVDMEKWVEDRSWVIMRLPTGQVGRESARLIASVVYNIFDAAFRKATANARKPIPFYFVIDEAQEIGTGMHLESMLSEGAKFGARMLVLTQSMAMMSNAENMGPLVQSLLANTSTQAFFSPDPEDADTIRAILSSSYRYGDVTLDLPTLQCWLRARIGGRWQPPTLVKIPHVGTSDLDHVQQVIREVIAAHPEDYRMMDDWQRTAMEAIANMLPESSLSLLRQALTQEDLVVKLADLRTQQASREEALQEKMRAKKKQAEAEGQDPADIQRPDQYQKTETPRPAPRDEEESRIMDMYIEDN
jgi:hypothetical protein